MNSCNMTLMGMGFVVLGALSGCGASRPPQQLLDARAAYQHAIANDAQQYSPAALANAQGAMQSAEHAFAENGDEQRTRDLAYIAERKSDIANVDASAAKQTRREQLAMDQVLQWQQALAHAHQGDLEQARAQLATTGKQLQASQDQLESERQAREDSENRMRDALKRLVVAYGGSVTEQPRGTVVTLPGAILFASGQSDLAPGARARLDGLAQALSALKDQRQRRVIVEGHTDSTGSDATNLALSQSRAETVRQYLVSKGLPEDQVMATGVGSSQPLQSDATAKGRAANRRVELIIEGLGAR
ncbi:MAG TPA: OmpA family protein [Polyangiaceae bacterium]|nr:OmpA family protein [Polyangiaceae bacterium]